MEGKGIESQQACLGFYTSLSVPVIYVNVFNVVLKGGDVGYCTETLIPWYGIIGWTGAPNTMSFKDIFLLTLKLSFFSVKCFPHIPKLMFIKGKCLRRLAKKKKKYIGATLA